MEVKKLSWSSFPLTKEIRKSLKEHGFVKPLPIQVRSLRAAILEDKNIFGAARTGSGKTLAYAIPLVNRILTNRDKPCSELKKLILKKQLNSDDFGLVDDRGMEIDNMIIDRLSSSNDEASDGEDSSPDSSSIQDLNESTDDQSCPEAVILVPTRELAIQVKESIDQLCKHTNIKSCCLVGGLSQDKQVRVLQKVRPEIIIATPGRLYDMVDADEVQHINRQSIASIRTLVVDEADRMMQKGHFAEMIKLIDIVKEAKANRDEDFSFRVYLFSATLIFIHELPDRLKLSSLSDTKSKPTKKRRKVEISSSSNCDNKKNKIKQMLTILGIERKDTKVINLNDQTSHGRPSSNQLREFKVECLPEEKDLHLYYFLVTNRDKRTIVFCNSKTCLRRLSNVIKFLGIPSLKLYADMDQKKRLLSLDKFKNSSDHVLIATDVAARGLDIKDLECVVHYQVPKICESYIHRSGRTARLDSSGICLILCEPKEITHYKKLCNTINSGKDMDTYDINLNLKKLLKVHVDLARQCDILDHKLRDSKSDRDWFTKAAKDCDMELDDEDFRRLGRQGKFRDQNQIDEAKDRRRLQHLKKQLDTLLKRPIPA